MGYFSVATRDRLVAASDAALAERLDRYGALLATWARRINLTAIHDPDEVADKHFLDSLALLPHVPDSGRLVDVGTGAGFPGLVLALARPELHVTLVEPTQKRVAFLRTAIRELGAPNAVAHAERLEQHLVRPDFAPYDVAVSRATFHLPEWLDHARPLVTPGGLIIGMEGAEDHTLPDGATRVPYTIASGRRALILWRPGIAGP